MFIIDVDKSQSLEIAFPKIPPSLALVFNQAFNHNNYPAKS